MDREVRPRTTSPGAGASTGRCLSHDPGRDSEDYTVTASDVGHTLRATVRARNAAGVTPAHVRGHRDRAPVGLPGRHRDDPGRRAGGAERLEIIGASLAAPLTRSTRTLRIRFEIQACGGRSVQGATVFATAIPFNQFAGDAGDDGRGRHGDDHGGRRAAASPQRPAAAASRSLRPRDEAGRVGARRRFLPPRRRVPVLPPLGRARKRRSAGPAGAPHCRSEKVLQSRAWNDPLAVTTPFRRKKS